MKRYLPLIFSILIVSGIAMLIVGLHEEIYCGRIKYKIDATRFSKHNAYADPIFVVQFEFGPREIHPSWDNYMSHDVGDNICYYLQNHKYGSILCTIGFLIMILSLIALICYWINTWTII